MAARRSVLNQIAHFQGRRDEVPNQRLAEELARTRNRAGVREIASHLADPDRGIRSDCVKVLYEVGYLAPELVAPYASEFLTLLESRDNRLVWGGMIALSTVAALAAPQLYARRAALSKAIETGSVITVDNGIKTLAIVASRSAVYRKALLPQLIEHLRSCRPKDLPQHAEHVVVAVDARSRPAFVEILTRRMAGMPASRITRLRRVIRTVEGAGRA